MQIISSEITIQLTIYFLKYILSILVFISYDIFLSVSIVTNKGPSKQICILQLMRRQIMVLSLKSSLNIAISIFL